jgi:F-type H+-transporting ATPase subunit b
LPNLSLDASFFIQLAIFLMVMLVLNHFVFKPLGRHKELRDQTFDSLDEELKTADISRNEMISEYNGRIDGIKEDILAIKADIKHKSDQEKDAIITRAREEAEEFLRKEEEELKAAAVDARHFLDTQTRDLASRIFAKIMGRSPKVHH